jgi:hypothetical protein
VFCTDPVEPDDGVGNPVACYAGAFSPLAPAGQTAGAPGSGRARARSQAQDPTPRVDDSMRTDSGHPTALDTLTAPVTVLVGHFGAGKSEIAVNLAFGWRARGEAIAVVDLDVVKPYFRSRLLRDEMEARGITLVVPQDDRFYADLPIIVPEVRGAVGRAMAGQGRAILDAGGADVGSRVLGSIAGLDDPALADVIFVVNGNRPFAESPDAVIGMLREIERAAKVRVTGLAANTHLINETTDETVTAGLELANAVSRVTGLPVRFWAMLAHLAPDPAAFSPLPWLPLTRLITTPLDAQPHGLRRRSSIV